MRCYRLFICLFAGFLDGVAFSGASSLDAIVSSAVMELKPFWSFWYSYGKKISWISPLGMTGVLHYSVSSCSSGGGNCRELSL